MSMLCLNLSSASWCPQSMYATQGQSTKAARQGRSDCWTDDAAAFWRVNSLLPSI